jgi:hypothetical protein
MKSGLSAGFFYYPKVSLVLASLIRAPSVLRIVLLSHQIEIKTNQKGECSQDDKGYFG